MWPGVGTAVSPVTGAVCEGVICEWGGGGRGGGWGSWDEDVQWPGHAE